MPADPLRLRPEVEALEASLIQQVWEMGFDHPDAIGLWVGESDVPTPAFICEAAARSLTAGSTFYTHKRGSPALRRALADYHARLDGIAADPERITVTSSGMTGIGLLFSAMLPARARIVIVSPIWPNVVAAAKLACAEVVDLPLDRLPQGGFHLDLDRLEDLLRGGDIHAVFFASPANPTGWMAEAAELEATHALCRRYGAWAIADEVYQRFTYDRPHAPSILTYAEPGEPVVAVHSFSKSWAMTGWRVGWLVHPPQIGTQLGNLIEYSTSGGQAFLQEGCLTAIRDGEPFVAEMVERCRQGGEIVFQTLSACPRVRVDRPKAAFYSFFAVDGVTDSLAFAKRALVEAGVGLAPGRAFGTAGEGYLRLCFASSPARVAEAMSRLRPLLAD